MTNSKVNLLKNQGIVTSKPSILVVTPSSELGEIICESIKEQADVEHFPRASKAISSLRRRPNCRQAILDMDLGEVNLMDLGRALRLINPEIEILIISNNEPPTDLEDIQPWKFLRKPLLLRELQAALGLGTANDEEKSNIIDLEALENEDNTTIRWSNNPALATRYLSRLIEKSFAQEALLIQNQTLWSYAGRLPVESVHELNTTINKCMANETKCDFTRFIRLETTQSEHALYASFIALGLILALVFDPDIPFGVVRKQTRQLANTLLLLDGEDVQVKSLSSGGMENKVKFEEKKISWKQEIFPSLTMEDEGLGTGSTRYSDNTLWNPFPVGQPSREKTDQTSALDLLVDFKKHDLREEQILSTLGNKVSEEVSDLTFTQSENYQLSFLHEFIPDALYNLTYSFLLIPRFVSHHRASDREDKITDCIKRLHISYGWRLELLEVQSEYLRWVSSFPPNLAPSKHIDTIRKETSKRLFEDFPQFKQQNPSGDYWAPGFLIVGGKNAISDQLLMAFSKQNRKKHGIGMD